MKHKCWCGKVFTINRGHKAALGKGQEIHCTQRCAHKHYLMKSARRKVRQERASHRDIEAARIEATTNCAKYDECLDKAYITDKPMRCDICESPVWKPGAWMKSHVLNGFDNNEETTINFDRR